MLQKLKNKIIVSVQAMPDEPLHQEIALNAMIKSVVSGGAKGLRLAGERDIKNAKKMFPDIPVIGITKPAKIPENYLDVVYITPTLEDAEKIIKAGADIVALDATMRKRPNNQTLSEIINFIKSRGKLAMADIATYEEAKNAINLGADIVSTTLSGYTAQTKNLPPVPDFELCRALVRDFRAPVIVEGKIWTPGQAEEAFKSGAFCVVIGSAITRPQLITKRFTEILK